MPLYPLKFSPRYVPKMWGGRKIETILGKTLPPGQNIGESWELFDFPPGVVEGTTGWVSAQLLNGPLKGKTLHELLGQFGREVHGDVPLVGEHGQFPILIKFLDAREDLSVQVHPPRSYADSHPGAHLKSEAWYVLQSDPGARILKDLVPGTTRTQFEQSIRNGDCDRLIQSIPVKPGDCHYLPSGTVHALGAGILCAEVQTPSDTTFRVFDFNRIDPSTGTTRKLHVEQALECIDFTHQPAPAQKRSHVTSFFTTVTRLVSCEFFNLEKVRFTEGVDEAIPYDQPVVWIMLQGQVELRVSDLSEPILAKAGETILLPASMSQPRLRTLSDAQWLEVTFPTD